MGSGLLFLGFLTVCTHYVVYCTHGQAVRSTFTQNVVLIVCRGNDKSYDVKDEFYERLDKNYGECPKHDAQVEREGFFHPVIGRESLHAITNDDG